MSTKYLCNPAKPESRELAELLSSGFPETEEITSVFDYGKTRNKVLAFDYKGNRYVVKYFAKPSLIEKAKVLLGFKSKARKGYDNSFRILDNGISTATPIAIWETYRYGILTGCGLITDFLDGLCVGLIHVPEVPEEERHRVGRAFSDFTLRMHLAGLYPKDYNVGNVIVKTIGEPNGSDPRYQFSLIDTNRFNFGKIPGKKKAMKGFDQLGVYNEMFDSVVVPYSTRRGWDAEECRKMILASHARTKFLKRIAHLFK